MQRRAFLKLAALGAAGVAAPRAWGFEGIFNPCQDGPMPDRLLTHEIVTAAWEGLNAEQVWDCHVHMIGVGDSDSGIWITPKMQSWLHPIQSIQRYFYQNAACAEHAGQIDNDFRNHLVSLARDFKPGAKFMLLAFDFHHDTSGHVDHEHSAYYTPDNYAARIARAYPERFEWIASVHPYRPDAVAALEAAVANGARAIKWLPPAMGMDPASPQCDEFYAALASLKIPLLSHGGDELAVHSSSAQALGNPLRLRRALDHGVRVVVAHCATLGTGVDLDKGDNGPLVANFDLFARLMEEPRYEHLLFGELSALTQINRMGTPLKTLLTRTEWHTRLVNGSDYPLPGVMPLFSPSSFVDENYFDAATAKVLSEIRRYNPMLFDFVLKRQLSANGKKFAPAAFESGRVFGAVPRVTSPQPSPTGSGSTSKGIITP